MNAEQETVVSALNEHFQHALNFSYNEERGYFVEVPATKYISDEKKFRQRCNQIGSKALDKPFNGF